MLFSSDQGSKKKGFDNKYIENNNGLDEMFSMEASGGRTDFPTVAAPRMPITTFSLSDTPCCLRSSLLDFTFRPFDILLDAPMEGTSNE